MRRAQIAQLLDRRGAERVAGGEHRPSCPSALNLAASLPIVVVLPEPLTPTTRMTNGRLLGVDVERPGDRRERALDLGGEDRLHRLGIDALARSARAPIASRMRVAAPRPRSAWIRTSSRSSSEAASSLRLVKMSVTPRPMLDRRARQAEPEPLKPAPLRRGRRATASAIAALRPVGVRSQRASAEPAARPACSRRVNRPSAGGRRAQRRRTERPQLAGRSLRFLLGVVRSNGEIILVAAAPMRAARRVGYLCPHDAGRNKSAAALSRRIDARPRQAGRASRSIAARRAARASRTISTRCASACRASPRSPTGSTATPPAASCSDDITRRWRNWGSCSSRARSRKTYWAIVAGAPEADERRDRPAARPARRQARLVDEGRPERASRR